MVQKVRDRIINASIMTASGVGVALLTFFLQSSKADANAIEEELNGKLDKIEFKDYKLDHAQIHEKEQKDIIYIRGRLDDIYDHLLNK
jgi:hypothetical protein